MTITPRHLVYLYVALVILEGALRKWFLPEALGSLVAISRDPIALYLVWHGFRAGLFRPSWLRNLWLLCSFAMAVSGLLSLFNSSVSLTVWAFGLRTNCLHLPLILIIPRLIAPADLDRLLRRLLLLAFPIALLMLWQYRSPIDSWINSSALEGVKQIYAVEGKVRPPGPFSYITGAAEYFSLINAYLLGGLLDRRLPMPWILYGLVSTLLALSVSGSRLMLASVLLVWAGTIALIQLRDFRIPHPNILIGGTALAILLLLVVNLTPLGSVLSEGWSTTSDRLESANSTDGGVVSRVLASISIPDDVLWHSPPFGHGLGLGTNFGAKSISGKVGFALAESELQRIILESGLFFAGLFLILRWCFSLFVGYSAWRIIARFNRLAIALYLANINILLFGQIGRPTTMGFVVLCLAFSLASSRFTRYPATQA